MKKLLFISLIVMAVFSYQLSFGAQIRYRYQHDQLTVKKDCYNPDGQSFEDFERIMREKHPGIPPIILVDELNDDAAYIPGTHSLMVNRNAFQSRNTNEVRWFMLHENGHAQRPEVIPCILSGVTVVQALSLYYWGLHRNKSYKNILTKLCSKMAATLTISYVVNTTLMKAEERRADAWANGHADADTLRAGYERFQDVKKQRATIFPEYCGLKVPSAFIDQALDPLHPSVDFRMRNIKQALKDRFNIDA